MRKDIAERRSDILAWINANQSKAYMCRQLRCKPITLNGWLEKMGIRYKGNIGGKGIKSDPKRKSALEYSKGLSVKSFLLKRKLLEDGIKKEVCEKCRRTKWMGKMIPLELHHMDGNRYHNDFSNLAILCPNCHALEPNNSGKAIGTMVV